MQITAEDADAKETINAKIAYSILKQLPDSSSNMFTIDRDTGKIYVKKHTLDREVCGINKTRRLILNHITIVCVSPVKQLYL